MTGLTEGGIGDIKNETFFMEARSETASCNECLKKINGGTRGGKVGLFLLGGSSFLWARNGRSSRENGMKTIGP